MEEGQKQVLKLHRERGRAGMDNYVEEQRQGFEIKSKYICSTIVGVDIGVRLTIKKKFAALFLLPFGYNLTELNLLLTY